MFRFVISILLITINLNCTVAQFLSPYGMLGPYGAPGLINPYLAPVGYGGIGMGMDSMLMSGMGMGMGMNMLGNPYMAAAPYVAPPFGFTNNGNTFAGYGTQKYGSPMYSRTLNSSMKRYTPGFGCMNRSGCGTGYQKKE